MKLNLRNLEPLGFKGGIMTSKTSITLLWRQIGNNVFYASGYGPGSIGVFRLSEEQAKEFQQGNIGLLPPGFCSPMGGKVITENHRELFRGEPKDKRHFQEIIDKANMAGTMKKDPPEKSDQLVIEVTIPLNHKRTVKQRERLLEFINWCIEDKLTEFNPDGGGDDETHADTHDIGSVLLDSEVGMREICV